MKTYRILILLAAVLLAACNWNQSPTASPSGVLKSYVAASQKQDIAAMRSMLSKGSLELLDKSARDQGLTTDDILRREASVKIPNAPETRNEKIEGETATVEVKNETTGEFDITYPFVRENGAWKLARDKYIESLIKKASSSNNAANSNTASAPVNK